MPQNISTYFLVLAVCLILTIPLEFVFGLNVIRKPSYFLKAVWLPATVYIVWDIFATANSHWAFTDKHVSNIKLLDLPIEEYLFFLVIPLCSVLTYEAVKKVFPSLSFHTKYFYFFLCAYLILGIAIQTIWSLQTETAQPDRISPYYTLITVLAVALFSYYWLRKNYHKEHLSYMLLSLAICLVFMVFINGFLTKLTDPVVTYSANIGPRLFIDIPVEDFFYGSVLILWTLCRYKNAQK